MELPVTQLLFQFQILLKLTAVQPTNCKPLRKVEIPSRFLTAAARLRFLRLPIPIVNR